jgi:chemotaxis protein MotB
MSMARKTTADSLVSTDDEAPWLVTYADLMTLLLVFFVLLFSLSSLDKERYKSAVERIKVQIDQKKDSIALMELMEVYDNMDQQIIIEDVTGLRTREAGLIKDINRFVVNKNDSSMIKTHMLEGKIIITINGQALFNSGSAALKTKAVPILDQIVSVVFEYPEYDINIKGYTDDIPIATDKFPSNWELSAIRATTVLKHLILRGIKPNRLTATGYADMDPLYPNISDANRALNRRVEFVLEKKTTPQ